MWRNKTATHLWLKPKHLLIELCTINLLSPSLPANKLSYLPDSSSRCFLTGSSLQAGAGKLSKHGMGVDPWIVINCALPQSPNTPGLRGETLGAWSGIIYVPQHWDLTHSTVSAGKPSKAAKAWEEEAAVIHGVISSPLHPWPWWHQCLHHEKTSAAFQGDEKYTHQSFLSNALHRSPRTAKNECKYPWWPGVLIENMVWSLHWEYCDATNISGCHVQLPEVSSGTDERFVRPGDLSSSFCPVREVLEEPLLCKMHRDPIAGIQVLRFNKNSTEMSQESWSCWGPRGETTDSCTSFVPCILSSELAKGLKCSFS